MAKSKTKVMLCLLTLIISISAISAIAYGVTYGPYLDTLYGEFHESPAIQEPRLRNAYDAIWPDIRQPAVLRRLQDDGYTVVQTPEGLVYYHIDFNMRDQVGNGTWTPCSDGTYSPVWRNVNPANTTDYFRYYGTWNTITYVGDGYAPLNNTYLRHAVAHCLPKDEIVATVYGGISGAAIDSLIPAAQRAWYSPGVDGHPLALGDPEASTVWDGADENHDACSILRAGGFIYDSEGPMPVAKYSDDDPDGNWIEPLTGDYTNIMVFAGVTEDIAPDSFGRDDMCYRNFRAIGLPIAHPEVDYGYMTDTMMDHYQFDLYALGWGIGRFPDHLYSFFHSDNNHYPEGYNIPGIVNTELDGYCETIQYDKDIDAIKAACAATSDLLAELCVSIPTVTRPFFLAAGKAGAPGFTDSVAGIVNIPGFGADTDWTFVGAHWASAETPSNPLGIGGSMNYIVPSEPTNYHPAFASTTDEFLVLQHVQEGLINIDPYTHEDIPQIATAWTIEDWDFGGSEMGMNMTFWIRDDVYFHDGVQLTADTCEFGLMWLQELQIGRAQAMWQDLVSVEVHNDYCFSVYHNRSSLWTFYDVAGWAPIIPPHIYNNTDINYRPEEHTNPLNENLTCLVHTGPFMITDLVFELGGFVELTAYRNTTGLVSTNWWQTVEGYNHTLTTAFHWVGDGTSDGVVDLDDLTALDKAYGTQVGDNDYNADADTAPELVYHTNDGRVDVQDIIEMSKAWGKQKNYA